MNVFDGGNHEKVPIFNGLFCAEGSYKQFKSFAMPSNEEDRRGTSDNDTVREERA